MTNKSNTITLGGVGIHYAEALGDGDALVLLHGITDSLDTYEPLLPELSQWAHVYALDLRVTAGRATLAHTARTIMPPMLRRLSAP
jgi:pimeloyl-ACP methyl ester carboxylesterase